MKLNTAPKAAALSLVAAFSVSNNVDAQTCTGSNTTDLKAENFDLEAPTPALPVSMGWFLIKNVGTNPTSMRTYFDIFETDANQNDIAHLKVLYSDNIIQPGATFLRATSFNPVHMSEGRYYRAAIRYGCDSGMDNNNAFQRAYSIGGTVPDDRIFADSFEQSPAALLAESFAKYANDNNLDLVIEETRHDEDGGFSIQAYTRPKAVTPKP